MAVVNPVVFQIVGYQNSGKTTLVKKIIQSLSLTGINTVTLKHHGHGGKPIVAEKKDSYNHISAGATASLVEGDGRLIVHGENISWSLEEKLELMSFFRPNVILIEGHKHASYEKAIIIKKKEDQVLLSELINIKAVFYWDKELVSNKPEEIPAFHIEGSEGVEWLTRFLMNNIHSQ